MTKAVCTIIFIIVLLLCTAMWIAISLSEESGTTMISQLQTSKELIMPCSNMTQVVLTEVNRRQPRSQKISLNLLKTMLYSSLGNKLITSSSFRVLQSCLQVTITFCKRSQCPLEKSATKSVQLLVHLWKQQQSIMLRSSHHPQHNLSSFSLFPSPSSHNPPDVQ